MRYGADVLPRDVGRRRRSTSHALAEDLGYDDLWILDQSFHHDPFLLLAACASATSWIRLGVAVTNPVSRHPVQIARAAATLAELSGGRFVLGIGAGNRTRVLPALGLPTDLAATGSPRRSTRAGAARRRGGLDARANARARGRPPGVRVVDAGPDLRREPRTGHPADRGAKADGAFVEAMFTPEGMAYALGEIGEGAGEVGRDPARVEVVAWQALRLSTTVAAADEHRYRRWAALLMRNTARMSWSGSGSRRRRSAPSLRHSGRGRGRSRCLGRRVRCRAARADRRSRRGRDPAGGGRGGAGLTASA